MRNVFYLDGTLQHYLGTIQLCDIYTNVATHPIVRNLKGMVLTFIFDSPEVLIGKTLRILITYNYPIFGTEEVYEL